MTAGIKRTYQREWQPREDVVKPQPRKEWSRLRRFLFSVDRWAETSRLPERLMAIMAILFFILAMDNVRLRNENALMFEMQAAEQAQANSLQCGPPMHIKGLTNPQRICEEVRTDQR